MNRLRVLVLLIVSIACQTKPAKVSRDDYFAEPVSTGIIKEKKLREASGLIASVNNPGMLWTHNDSGNDSELFLIDTLGELLCTVKLKGIKNRDWEDITIGTGPDNTKTYLYIGEIGDNNAVYDHKFIYRFEEPTITDIGTDTTIEAGIDEIKFRLSDGKRDTESLMLDPLTQNFYIFSKREQTVNLYKLSHPLSTSETMTAERVVEDLPFTLIVAGDISPKGDEILAKNYDKIFYWKRNSGETVEQAVVRAGTQLPYASEPQGEAIAFNRQGTGFFTLSEKKKKMPQHLFFYKRN